MREKKYFEKFQNTLNDIIIEVASRQSLLYKNNLKITCSSHYDAINGLSGVAIYLLTLRSENAEKCLRDILSYFVELSLLKTVNGILVPGWYVSKDCLPTDEYKRDFQKGCINFSLSHGIAGPLYILGKSMSVGIEVDGQRKAIERILGEYNKVFTYVDGVCIWPGMMKLEDYLSKKDITNNLRMSWCYGSLGVLRSIIVAADAIGNKPLVKWGEIQLLKIIEMPIKQFYLDSPIICHGYAGVCGMLRKTYEGNKQRDCLSKSKEVLKILLNMYEPTFPYGYKDYMRKYTDKGFVEEYTDKLTFLEGATGIYLELLTFLKEKNHFEKSLFLES